jgi:hypothetical protein
MVTRFPGTAKKSPFEEISFYRQLGMLEFVSECVRDNIRKVKSE